MIANFLSALRTSRGASDEALRQIADGKRVRFGSDDAFGAAAAIRLRSQLVRLEGYGRAASTARSDLSLIETSLGEAYDLVLRARDLALAGASTAIDSSAMANEIRGLRDQLLVLANGRQHGRYLFGGTLTLDRPFDDDGVYQGNSDESVAEIADGETVATTLDGSRAFDAEGNIFETLDNLALALEADDEDGARALIDDLEKHLQAISFQRSDAGQRLQRIDAAAVRADDLRFMLQQQILEIENIDLEEAVTNLASADRARSAVSAAAASVLGRSLFDFLG